MKRAFTLVELLVVVAIICTLAALLFPALFRAKEKARRTACSNNLAQISRAMRMYLDDNDQRYPEFYDTWMCKPWADNAGIGVAVYERQPHERALRVILDPYAPAPETWHCPSDIGEIHDNVAAGYNRRTLPFFGWHGASYQSASLHNKTYGYPYVAGRAETDIKTPADTAWIWDATYWHDIVVAWDPVTNKRGFNNVAYCDGHVKSLLYNEWLQVVYRG